MRRRDFYWSLYSVTQKNQLDNLRTDQAEAIFAAIPESLRKDYFIWRDGFEGWKPFSEFPELLVALRNVDSGSLETPPPPGAKVSAPASKTKVVAAEPIKAKKSSSAATTVTGRAKGPQRFEMDANDESNLALDQESPGEERNNFRFDKQFDVVITANEKTYPNRTMNISLKGMQLEKPLPKNLPRYFNVEIKRKDKIIPVLCSEIKSKDGKSSRIKIEVNNYTSGLLEMLLGAY